MCPSHFILLAAKQKDKQQEGNKLEKQHGQKKREKQQGDEEAVNVSVSVVVTLL